MTIPLPELIERYKRLSSSVVYDILDTMDYPKQALKSDIKPLHHDMKVAGPAFTFVEEEAKPKQISPWYEAFRAITPGSVIVMTTHGHSVSGPWGENTSLFAKMRGAQGIVIDGGTRDAKPLIDMGFPTFCQFVTPVFSRNRCRLTAYDKPIQVLGQIEGMVTINSGDFVVGDLDGVVIVPRDLAESVLAAAEQLELIEQKIRAGIRLGEDREIVDRRHPKFAHLKKEL